MNFTIGSRYRMKSRPSMSLVLTRKLDSVRHDNAMVISKCMVDELHMLLVHM
jgi:hypothetical protein